MGRQPIEKEIDGEQYTFCFLNPRLSIDLLTRIAHIIVPSISSGYKGDIDINTIMDSKIDINSIVTELFKKINSNEILSIIDVLFTQVIHKGEGRLSDRIAFDKLFTGNLKHLFKVVKESLEAQYADFFGEKDALTVLEQFTAK
jgi:hypothetical protein